MLPVTDVMAAGHHAAVKAGMHPGDTAIVIGDGAVGLCGTLAARRLGAGRIVVLGHQPLRLELARLLGATDVVTTRRREAISEVLELTKGGGHAVLECVGSEEALNLSVSVARPGGMVGFVGIPHGSGQVPMQRMFYQNIGSYATLLIRATDQRRSKKLFGLRSTSARFQRKCFFPLSAKLRKIRKSRRRVVTRMI